MSLVDTHCHINDSAFDGNVDEVIDRARRAGVSRLLVVGCDVPSSRRAVEIASAHDGVAASVGLHPEYAPQWTAAAKHELIELAKEARSVVAAWGEIGLDYYWDSVPRQVQRSAFVEQIEIASDLDLPMTVHCRDSYSDVLDILAEHPGARAALHCFAGSRDEAQRAMDLGCFIGAGGIATFKKSDDLRAVLRSLPAERLILETDSPYLAPQARRGRRNEPAYVALIAEALASTLGMTPEDLAAATTSNAARLFGSWVLAERNSDES